MRLHDCARARAVRAADPALRNCHRPDRHKIWRKTGKNCTRHPSMMSPKSPVQQHSTSKICEIRCDFSAATPRRLHVLSGHIVQSASTTVTNIVSVRPANALVSADLTTQPMLQRPEPGKTYASWQPVAANAGWQARDSQGEVVFNDKLFLLGGWFDSFASPPRDVWSVVSALQ